MTVMWTVDNTTRYSVPGVKLTIAYEVATTSSFTPGNGEISVKLPNFSALKAAGEFNVIEDIGAGCVIAPQARAEFETIKLNNVIAFSTTAEQESAETKRNNDFIFGSLVVGVVIILIFLFASWVKNKSR